MLRPTIFSLISVITISALLGTVPTAQPRALRVHISVDMEGVVGTVTYYADASAQGLGWPSGWAGLRLRIVGYLRRLAA